MGDIKRNENAGDKPVALEAVETVAVFMDVPNIMGSSAVAGGHNELARFSFRNILRDIRKKVSTGFTARTIREAHAVNLLRDRSAVSRKVQAQLEGLGFTVHNVVQKSPRSMHHNHLQGHQPEEGSVDLELTNRVWSTVLKFARNDQPLDTIVLIAGDGDYRGLVKMLRAQMYRVVVYGPVGCTSRSLQHSASELVMMSHQTPKDLPEKERFIFFAKESASGLYDAYGDETALDDANNPAFFYTTGTHHLARFLK